MLAYEVARHLKPDAVLLIASCRTSKCLRPWQVRCRHVWPIVPVQVWSLARLFSGPVMWALHRRSPVKRQMLVRMFKESDPRFMHWVVRAILNWQPEPLEGVPVYQIHGSRDIMISARRVQPDVLIPGGGHLINMSRADDVNSFIAHVAASCGVR
jgi:pimeloyl-ACP methyl ester carboxylesterase